MEPTNEHPAHHRDDEADQQEQDPSQAQGDPQVPWTEPGPSVGIGRGELPGKFGRVHLRRRLLGVGAERLGKVELETIALSHR